MISKCTFISGEPFVRLSRPISQHSEVRMGRSASITFPETINDLEEIDEFYPSLYNEKLQYNDSNYLPYGQATSQVRQHVQVKYETFINRLIKGDIC